MTTRTRAHRREQPDSAPGLRLIADGPQVSQLVRTFGAPDTPTPKLAKAIEDAVAAGVTVEFYAADGDQVPAFRLRHGHGAIHVVDGEGAHMGTFASGAAAVAFGWRATS